MSNKHPAAFINMIAEGKNFDECLTHLKETWEELMELPKWRIACKTESRKASMYQRKYIVAQAQVDELKKWQRMIMLKMSNEKSNS